jgi:hypothetical protein
MDIYEDQLDSWNERYDGMKKMMMMIEKMR